MDESQLFRKLIREKSLKHPTARQFDGGAWADAARGLETLTERDQQLLFAATHYGRELALLRGTFEKKFFVDMSRREAVLLSIAMANYNYSILTETVHKQAKKSARRAKEIHLGVVGRETVQGPIPGNESTPDTIVANIVDTLPHCLERAGQLPEGMSTVAADFWQRGAGLFATFSIEHSLRDLWQRVLWEGWKIEPAEEGLRQGPVARDLAVLWEVWIWREESLLTQGSNLDAVSRKLNKAGGTEPFVAPTAVGIGGASRGTRSFRFGVVAGREFGQVWHRGENDVLEACYLSQFLDAPLPRIDSGLTCRDLQRAWCVLRDCARILANKARNLKFKEIDSVESRALLIRRSELVRALVCCLKFDTSAAEEAIRFFSCDVGDLGNLFTKGFWSAPLLDSGGDDIAIVFAAISVGSVVRRVESWLDRGGLSDHLSDARRGIKYEAWVRDDIADAILRNGILANSCCATSAVSRYDSESEQIDLLIVLGNLLLVGEVKCFLYPVESSERHNYLRRLNDAGNQASRKAKWASENPSPIADALKITEDRVSSLRVVPIIVVNQGAGFGLKASGVRVVDCRFLRLYLANNEFVAGMAFNSDTGQVVQELKTLYGSEAEAANNFEKTMESPLPLERYLNAATWKDNLFPMSDGGRMVVENCLMGDAISDDARKLTSMLWAKS